MILLDAVYIHNYGGKTILDLIIKFIIKNKQENSFYLLLDSRYQSLLINKFNFEVINGNEKKRKLFYKSKKTTFSRYLCLSNVPPPIKIKKEVWIYFHNDLFIDFDKLNLSIKSRILLFLKYKYIKYKNQKNYKWIVQSNLMKNKLSEKYLILKEKIIIKPVFDSKKIKAHKKEKKTFLYVSSFAPHKNLNNLIIAFSNLSKKASRKIELHLTVTKKDLSEVKINYDNLNIFFHGKISKTILIEIYKKCEFLIYPSLKESFGLPIIEATNHGCKVIASDLPFVHEIIKPSLTFDPYSVESISKAILKAIETNNLPKTKVLVENKLDNFINLINS